MARKIFPEEKLMQCEACARVGTSDRTAPAHSPDCKARASSTPDMTGALAWQHVSAPNDSNGNPRRVFVVYGRNGNFKWVIDEGYAGCPSWIRCVPELMPLNVIASEYAALKRCAKSAGNWVHA